MRPSNMRMPDGRHGGSWMSIMVYTKAGSDDTVGELSSPLCGRSTRTWPWTIERASSSSEAAPRISKTADELG